MPTRGVRARRPGRGSDGATRHALIALATSGTCFLDEPVEDDGTREDPELRPAVRDETLANCHFAGVPARRRVLRGESRLRVSAGITPDFPCEETILQSVTRSDRARQKLALAERRRQMSTDRGETVLLGMTASAHEARPPAGGSAVRAPRLM